MKEETKLRIFALAVIIAFALTGYLMKDKLPQNDVMIYDKYLHRHH